MGIHGQRSKVTLLSVFAVFAGTAVVAVAVADRSVDSSVAAKPLRLSDATMIVELNSTDRDAGIQVFLDGEPWTKMAVTDPRGRRILDVDAEGRLNNFGLTELFSESHEPELSELPLRKFKRRFPEGVYRFRGETVEDRPMVGKARFTHDIPPGPKITSPAAGATVPESGLVASWDPVPDEGDIEIKGYRAIVEREKPLRVFNADLPASQTRVTVPAEYLESGTKYKLEVQAIERSGNQTISEIEFSVG